MILLGSKEQGVQLNMMMLPRSSVQGVQLNMMMLLGSYEQGVQLNMMMLQVSSCTGCSDKNDDVIREFTYRTF